jgi:hypothetical protein
MPHQSPATGLQRMAGCRQGRPDSVAEFRVDLVKVAELTIDDEYGTPLTATGPFLRDHTRSKRSRFITLLQAPTKSRTNACCESRHA